MLSVGDFNAKQILVVVPKNKQRLAIKNDNILVIDEDGVIIHQSTCYRLFAVLVIGHISITDVLIARARKFGFAIAIFSETFRPIHVISAAGEGNVLLRRKQYAYIGLGGARSLISNKIANQHALLNSVRDKSDFIKSACSMLKEDIGGALIQPDIQSIMGVEGSASRVYFKSYFDNVEWTGRKPRIKHDMVNALLDIGYTVLFSFVECLLKIYGFDCYVGILHRQFYMRKSLVCDIEEPFRVIIDKQVKSGINLKQFKSDDFTVKNGKWCLNYDKSALYAGLFVNAVMKHKDSIFLYVRDFYRAVMREQMEVEFPFWESA